MTWSVYIRDKIKYLVALFVSALFTGMFLWILDVRKIFILFVLLFWVLPYLAVLMAEYFQKSNYYKTMEQMLEKLDAKTLLAETLEDADFAEGQILNRQLRIADKYMNEQIAVYDRAAKEYKEYVEMWVHEIKTPISVANLILEKERTQTNRMLQDELFSIERMVEQALFYARGSSVEKDFLIKKITLADIVSNVLKQNARPLIQAKTKIEQKDLNFEVFADMKWMVFILSQVLGNSIKYKKDALYLQFEGRKFENKVCLSVTDNGVGISSKEIGRIFEKGFTGTNGRKNENATGMGLYLCRKLAGKMNLSITASAKDGEGTTITISFPVGSMTAEVS